ncbi:Protein fam53b [Saguinus oedipus]|uniref:Protein fam53b n=1 Tax=Saguinus oedipus TaxID=9490 RepID=A0ABQ9W8U3_SAGOE|nr:Protein fam53b [Saguinus oedipus]
MILSESLSTRRVDSITCGTFSPELHTPKKMSQGPTLFSCGIMENDRWRDLDRKCPLQIDQPSTSIWECLPAKDSSLWHQEGVTAYAVTSLIKDLSISDHNGNPSAPPSKRQCHSLSFSDEMSICRTSWRPLGSKVWTPVEKRHCYSEGSVQRYSTASAPCRGAPASASLPGPLCSPPPATRQDSTTNLEGHIAKGCQAQPPVDRQVTPGALTHAPWEGAGWTCSANSTPTSTPELARRSSGLFCSRSQLCVLNDKKVGVKRQCPEEVQEQRPSLDFAKMAQNCQAFSSLSCLSTGTEDCSPQNPFACHVSTTRTWTALLSASGPGGRTPAGTPVPEPLPPSFDDRLTCQEDLSCEESDGCALDEDCSRRVEPATAWRERGVPGNSLCSLHGELTSSR